MTVRLILISLLFSFFALNTQAAQNKTPVEGKDYNCGEDVSGEFEYKFCITQVDRTKNPDIIYFLHGLNGSERSWFKDVDKVALQAMWKVKDYNPTVITISLGPMWLLVETSEYPVLDLFMNDILPKLEAKAGGLQKGRRILAGQSMGGFNAAQLLLKKPAYFQKVGLWCPAITTVGPYSSPKEIQDYIDRNKANPDRIRLMLRISKQVFTTPQEWDQHDPLLLLRNFSGAVKPQTFVSIGKRDEFGFYEGAKIFADVAKQKGFKTTFSPVTGPHCRFDIRGASDFIIGD